MDGYLPPPAPHVTKHDLRIATRRYGWSKSSSLAPWPNCCTALNANGKNSPILCDAVARETGDLAKASRDGRMRSGHGLAPFSRVFVEKPVCGPHDRAGFVC